ncbi:MAG: glycosyltransferase [Candidatus Omnitrophica bacterium]|nr:glycosyltransferase [Candidatus Omnitrophota bacterium]
MKDIENFPRVCFVILNWNGKELLKDCLSSILKSTNYPNYKVIIVDNGSTDGSVEYVRKNFKKVDVLELDKNYGFSKGNNEGIKYAIRKYNPKYLLFLNNDTKIVEKGWLRKMVEFAETDEKIGLIGCKAITLDNRIERTGFIDGKNIRKILMQVPKEMINEVCENFMISVCMLARKNVFEKVGGFDEVYSPYLWEDMDFFIRVKRAGFRIFYFGKTKIIHKVSQTLKKQENIKRIFFANRNEMIFYLRYGKMILPLRILRMFIRCFVTKNPETSYKTWIFYRNFLVRVLITLKAIYSAFKIYRRRETSLF